MANPPTDLGTIRQQIGEILGTVRSLAENMVEQKAAVLRAEDRLNAELRTLKHEQRNSDQLVSARIEIMANQIKFLDESTKLLGADLVTVKDSMQELRKLETPINSILAVRKKLVGYILLLFTLATAVWYAALPIIHTIIETVIKNWLGMKGGG